MEDTEYITEDTENIEDLDESKSSITEYNIINAYVNYHKQFVILISGLSGTNKSKIAGKIASKLKFKCLDTRDFIDMDTSEEVELPNKKVVKVWKNYLWDKIIGEIEKYKENGIVVCGEFFPSNKLEKIKIDLHIHIKLSKQNIIKKRLEYIENSTDKKKYHDNETESLIISQIIYPYYLEIIQKSIINKFINGNEIIENSKEAEFIEKIYDISIDTIVDHVVDYLKYRNLDKYIVY